ncbi:phage major capsid protein [Hymenobacter cheonanensis]|uniref:phage major capsid protein n=1 Tax=Hymenobacter sp. CA2-7 TaxID=3063993 RepID=UPI002713A915|nr:phage major capsid protein [Hymenobacter sp. CA2-7]MDO7888280.1 phage major capsid protein [Hymenobacter sp. CA2-7]
MKKLKELLEERAAKLKDSLALVDTAEAEKRDLTAEEATRFDALGGEIGALDVQITRARVVEAQRAAAAGAGAPAANRHGAEQERDLSKFSLRKMALDVMENRTPSGLEGEMHQEAVKEARGIGVAIEGVGIPSFLAMQQRQAPGRVERRDNSVTMPTQPADGSAVVFQDPAQPIQGLLRPALAVQALGARLLTGLVGEVPFPAITQGSTSTWKPEVAELDKSNVKFGRSKMNPHRLGTYLLLSKQFLIQTSPDIEMMIRQDLQLSVDHAVDQAAIYGDGQQNSNQPLGLLNTPGVYVANGGANGRVPTLNDIVGLEASVEIQNAAVGSLGYLMNSKIKGTLKTTPLVNSYPVFLLTDNNELNGHKLVVSNMVKDAPRGSATVASTVAYGDWSQMIIGQWGGLDLLVDPYTQATNGQTRLIVNSFWDILVRRAASFALFVGATPSAEIAALQPQ